MLYVSQRPGDVLGRTIPPPPPLHPAPSIVERLIEAPATIHVLSSATSLSARFLLSSVCSLSVRLRVILGDGLPLF